MTLWRSLSLAALVVFAVSGPAMARESLMDQQDQGLNVTETAVPPAADAMATSEAPAHVKKHHAASAHKAKKAKAHKVVGKKAHAKKAKKHKV